MSAANPELSALNPEGRSPKELLYPKQRKFVDDKSQFKIGVTTRQWGKSLTTSGEAVHDCLVDPGTKWVCMSAGERQALEWLEKAKEWLSAYNLVIEEQAEDRSGIAEGLLKSAEIKFANGSRIIAIPANPSTARGYSANIILDEFAYHENPDAIWAAMFPSTTNKLAGTFMDRWRAMLAGESTEIRRELKLRLVSTFNGRNNKFYEIFENAKDYGYSSHRVTIHDAIADGMPLDAEALRKALNDDDIFAQEYECEPIDTSAVLLTYDLLATCETSEATTTADPAFWTDRHQKRLIAGFDFGRKRDLSVMWTCEQIGDLLMSRDIEEMKKMSTPAQVRLVRPKVERCQRVVVDYTGPGIGLGDMLVELFGEWKPSEDKFGKIQLVTIGQKNKVEMFSRLKAEMEQGNVRIPVSRVIREDLHSMHRVVTANGGLTYRAPHTEDGHADRATALALCVSGAVDAKLPFAYEPVPSNISAFGRGGGSLLGGGGSRHGLVGLEGFEPQADTGSRIWVPCGWEERRAA